MNAERPDAAADTVPAERQAVTRALDTLVGSSHNAVALWTARRDLHRLAGTWIPKDDERIEQMRNHPADCKECEDQQ